MHESIRYQLATFFTIRTQSVVFYAWTVRRLCVTGTNLGQRKQNEINACAIYAMLDWRWFGVLLASTFTRGEMK